MALFVLVGHCGPDSYLLKHAVQRAVPAAKIVSCDDGSSLRKHLQTGGAVLLVNRVLDGGFGTRNGIDLISTLAAEEIVPVMVLISNYAEAQEQAVAAGARPGFGKSAVNTSLATACLREAAALAEQPAASHAAEGVSPGAD